MTDGTTRRKELMKLLQNEMRPLSGTELARHFGVSRQVIVQDIALLRATDRNILSTNKGYVLYHPEQEEERSRRILASHHDKERMQEELYLMVDCENSPAQILTVLRIIQHISFICTQNIAVGRTQQCDVLHDHLAAHAKLLCQFRSGQWTVFLF